MRRILATTAALVLTLAVAAGCGDDGGSSGDTAGDGGTGASSTSGSGSSGSSQDTEGAAKVIEVTFDGDSVTPNGERVDVAVGQPVELEITADAPGEIHVHTSPEQELEYDAGSSTLELDPLEQPGIVEVESHALEKTIVQLEVR